MNSIIDQQRQDREIQPILNYIARKAELHKTTKKCSEALDAFSKAIARATQKLK